MEGTDERLGGSTGDVVRVGDTVRRPAGRWSSTVDAVLRHLEAHGFPSPRPLGRDGQGRQTVTWLPGTATWEDHAAQWGEPAQLTDAARLVRRLHDTLDSFVAPPDASWKGGWGRPEGPRSGPVCHWDLAPYNVVRGPDGSLAVIDWEGCGPGDRMMELAYAVDAWVPLRRDEECARLGYRDPPPRVERVEVFVDAYGLPPGRRPDLADALVANAEDRAAFGIRMHEEGREPFASWWASDRGAGDRADLRITKAVARQWLRGSAIRRP